MPSSPTRTLAAGWRHSCAVIGADLRCWGMSNAGQVGDGSSVSRAAPVVVKGIAGKDVRMLALGHTHSCAVLGDDSLWCWGSGAFGELGIDLGAHTLVPKRSTLTGVRSVALGDQHTCALTKDGKVRCFGFNDLGQLGDGSTENRKAPVTVTGLAEAIDVAAGSRFSCALEVGGTIACWGNGHDGQLGDGTTTSRATPRRVEGVPHARRIVASAEAACALVEDGRVFCWGTSEVPQVTGTGYRLVPEVVAGGKRFVDLALGDRVLTARDAAGAVWCWGTDLTSTGMAPLPAAPAVVPELANATELAAGGGHVCGRTARGLACFGWNADGQVGDGSHTRLEPRVVPGLEKETPIVLAAGAERTCTAKSAGAPICWGGYELADDGTASPMLTPRVPRAWSSKGTIARMAVGFGASCAVLEDQGRLVCLVEPASKVLGHATRTTTLVELARGIADVAVGSAHVCFIDAARDVRCLGEAGMGATGPSARGNTTVAVVVPGLRGATRLASAGARTCAVVTGKVWCWGGGLVAHLDAIETSQPLPVRVDGLAAASEVAVGHGGGCAIEAGRVACWKDAELAPILPRSSPQATKPAPIEAHLVSGIAGATALATSGSHTCVILTGGEVRCWGRGEEGQLGDGAGLTRAEPIAVRVPPALRVATGSLHTCVTLAGGGVRCWGRAAMGLLGDGTGDVVARPTAADVR